MFDVYVSALFLFEMPKKISFRVVYCTGYEDDFPPKDLEVSFKTPEVVLLISRQRVVVAMVFVYTLLLLPSIIIGAQPLY